MKLAEALTERAELSRKIQDLRERIIRNAKHQEGDKPAEDPSELLKEYEKVTKEFIKLVVAINKTNQTIILSCGEPMIDALAKRDALKLQHSLYKSLATEATPNRLMHNLVNDPAS
ncbi:DIP1984 family protein [Thauera sp. SDU_THAU2]|uniref:DIP1984 family protein n=1 Tax=Thauera sp. SDU_THAU2 TaxID=3136633 RepID=UPI00311E7932